MSKQKQESPQNERLDKALNEIDVLPDSDQKIVRVDSTLFKFSSIDFELIENHQDAFDLEMMENRYTDYLLKYDYIVGDISYEKLRLRGFYEDYRKGVPIDMKISNLEDYLVEYCSFGCQYFVFERVEKDTADPESYFKKKKSNRSNRSNQQNKRQSNRSNQRRNKQSKQNKQSSQNKTKSKQQNKPSKQTVKAKAKPKNQKNFQVKKKETEQTKSNVKDNQDKKRQTSNKKQFKIRKKKD